MRGGYKEIGVSPGGQAVESAWGFLKIRGLGFPQIRGTFLGGSLQ